MNKEFLGQLPIEDQAVSDYLFAQAQNIQINPHFQSNLEARLKQAHPENKQQAQGLRFKILPALGWAILAIGAFMVLNWAIRALVPHREPAAGQTAVPIQIQDTPTPNPISEATSLPSGEEFAWHGTTLYLNAQIPENPTEANVFQYQPEQPATLESVRALAAQFGMGGNVYETPSETGNSEKTDFVVEDGNQRLQVRSNLYFSYYPDYTRWATGNVNGQIPNQDIAEAEIDNFMRSHGFDFPYKVDLSEFYTGYYALPLTSDGFAIRHEHFNAAGLLFRFDKDGLIAVEAGLADYSQVGEFGIISAESAFQKLLAPETANGIREGMHSVNTNIQSWYRARPESQTVTVWGWISSIKSVEGGAPLVMFDGYRATGNLEGLAESTPNTFVEATGQFKNIDGVKTFEIENWHIYEGLEDGLQGLVQREGDRVTITNFEGSSLTLPDVPDDLPLPLENAFVLGVTRGEVFEWKSIDTRLLGGGGGGGGGGMGFYKLNLTGTPVPFPTPETVSGANPEASEYVVQENDTLSKIAYDHGITVDELMQANELDNSTIFLGQTLTIPGTPAEQSPIGQRIEGQRGIVQVNIYRKPDGSQRADYGLVSSQSNQYGYLQLTGADLSGLDQYNNRPVDIWGTIESADEGTFTLNVERYEIPYPDLQFQILRGTQQIKSVEGQQAIVFTTDGGASYVQLTGYGDPDVHGIIGNPGDPVLLEGLLIPGETFGSYPTVRIHSMGMAISPKNGQEQELQITADQINIIDEPQTPEEYTIPTASIEKVELVYFIEDPRYKDSGASPEPMYIQPVWRFSGHYSSGEEFEALIQALQDEFLLPEVEAIEPPG